MKNLKSLKTEAENIKLTLDEMFFGSIEIRSNDNKKYIYVHYRNNGRLYSKYVGEYSLELHNLILQNNVRAKELKKRLKEINKQLALIPVNNDALDDNVKLNVDFARKYLVDSIYKQSILEGVATTYSDTETLVNEGKVKNMNSLDVQKIINLKHAWEFILDYDVESCQTNYALLCQINALVEEGMSSTAGRIRSVPVSIGGSTYLPPLPLESQIKDDILSIICSDENVQRKAAKLIAYTMKSQIFIDGNKRSAIIFGNHYLISHGYGLMVVPVNKISKYKKLLIKYYEGKSNDIIDFLINECFISIKEKNK